jgi:hypothetical protein
MYRLKIKREILKTSITLQRKIFGIWIYWNGYNVSSATPSFHETEAMLLARRLIELKNIPDELVVVI